MRTKFVLLILMFLAVNLLSAAKLGMFVEVKRYLDVNKNTRFEIDYQAPYKNLMFQARNEGFFAELKVTISIANKDSVIQRREFVNNIGVSNKFDVSSPTKSYLDRIVLVLSKPGIRLSVVFEDLNSDNRFVWNYDAQLLPRSNLLSDVEILKTVLPDTSAYLKNFHRNGKLNIPEPSGIIPKELYDTLYVYCELYPQNSKELKLKINLSRSDENILSSTQVLSSSEKVRTILLPLQIAELTAGLYRGTIKVIGDTLFCTKEFDFVLKEHLETLFFLFPDPDEEHLLIRNLATVKPPSAWRTYSKEAKRNYISNFWMNLAGLSGIPVEQLMSIYRDRIDYCNKYYSHFEAGWKTDLGRVYVRNGPPDELEKDQTSDETKYVRKDFQIWKYSSGTKPVYVFIDIQMNNNYQLIYVKNDDLEVSKTDWRKYLGLDFEESRLRN